MAQYNVTHSCNHTEVHNLFGPGREREGKLAWLESNLCRECYKASKRAEGPKFLVRIIPPADKAPAKVEIACYANSYDIRDRLKSRSWRFSDNVPRASSSNLLDFLSDATCKGWSLITADVDAAGAELGWIAENGWAITWHDRVTTALRSVMEGRPDLAGANFKDKPND